MVGFHVLDFPVKIVLFFKWLLPLLHVMEMWVKINYIIVTKIQLIVLLQHSPLYCCIWRQGHCHLQDVLQASKTIDKSPFIRSNGLLFFKDTLMCNNYENISEAICCNTIDRDIASSLVEAGLTERPKTHDKFC